VRRSSLKNYPGRGSYQRHRAWGDGRLLTNLCEELGKRHLKAQREGVDRVSFVSRESSVG
jgi:hypothetical protein